MQTLAYYTVTVARPTGGWGGLPELNDRAGRASEDLRGEGVAVRFVRSVFVPEDETCFYLYEAGSAAVVQEAARRADVPAEHVTEIVGKGGTT
jgi:hypothetical protein